MALRERELHAFGHLRRILMSPENSATTPYAKPLRKPPNWKPIAPITFTTSSNTGVRLPPVIGALHLTHGAELLNLEVQPPDCSRYEIRAEESAQPIATSSIPAI